MQVVDGDLQKALVTLVDCNSPSYKPNDGRDLWNLAATQGSNQTGLLVSALDGGSKWALVISTTTPPYVSTTCDNEFGGCLFYRMGYNFADNDGQYMMGAKGFGRLGAFAPYWLTISFEDQSAGMVNYIEQLSAEQLQDTASYNAESTASWGVQDPWAMTAMLDWYSSPSATLIQPNRSLPASDPAAVMDDSSWCAYSP